MYNNNYILTNELVVKILYKIETGVASNERAIWNKIKLYCFQKRSKNIHCTIM